MGDIFEKMGNLLSEKIENEMQNAERIIHNITESEIDNLQLKIENTENDSESETEIPLTAEQLSILNSQISIKKPQTAERIPSGNYTEDIPVKLITGTASFSSSSD